MHVPLCRFCIRVKGRSRALCTCVHLKQASKTAHDKRIILCLQIYWKNSGTHLISMQSENHFVRSTCSCLFGRFIPKSASLCCISYAPTERWNIYVVTGSGMRFVCEKDCFCQTLESPINVREKKNRIEL